MTVTNTLLFQMLYFDYRLIETSTLFQVYYKIEIFF